MAENIIMQLRSQYDFLTKVEKKITDVILSDPEKFITYSTEKAAEKCDVSIGSINNFARKFCPKGFSFFKLEIARCVSHTQALQQLELKSITGRIMNTMERKIRENISALCNTLEINSEKSMEHAVDMIISAKRIEVFGIFQSGIVAKNFSYKLIQLGIPASYDGDSLMFSVSASMLTGQDLVIAISASGETKDVLDAVKIAKENNVPVLSITENKFSTLGKLSDEILLTTAGHGRKSDHIEKMRTSQLLLIDTICNYISANSNRDTEKLKEIIKSHSIIK